MTTLLKVNNLGYRGKGYNSWLFKNVNLKINEGDIINIYGNGGSGKTLLADILGGYKKSSTGYVEKHAAVAMATQEFTLYKDLTVRENLDFISAINDVQSDMEQIIDLTGLTAWEKVRAGKLPAGLKKMLQIACAIRRKTPLIVFDEPTTGMDPELCNKFWQLAVLLAKEGRGIVIFTNQMMKEPVAIQIFNLTCAGLECLNDTTGTEGVG